MRAIGGRPLPVALVDLGAVDANVDTLVAPARAANKHLRVATKSIRSLDLTRHVLARGAATMNGVMSFSAPEAHWLARNGFRDILVAYPTAQAFDARLAAEANAGGAAVSLAVDDRVHLEVASSAARDVGADIPIVVDIDVSYRPLGDRVPIGVRRSPLRDPVAIGEFVERLASMPRLRFAGLLGYEAHIAGVRDDSGAGRLKDAATREMKRRAWRGVVELRARVVAELTRRGIAVPLFNGGGTGSVELSSQDASLTEIAAGSGFLDSHLFDGYRAVHLRPAAFFALQVTRKPSPGFVTCQSGGFVASGAAGRDRLPVPALPEGLELTPLEGAGEVQTPLAVPMGTNLALGAPIFFRHAKAGELAEHFREYLLVRGDRVIGVAETYRGAGQCFA